MSTTTTTHITPADSGPSRIGDGVAEVLPVVGALYVAGPPVLVAWTAIALFGLLLVGPFVLLVTLAVAVAALAAVVGLAAAVVAAPFVLVHHARLHFAHRRQVSGLPTPAPAATVVAPTRRAVQRLGLAGGGTS